MISCSNQHLQQQLEYTLLKLDCHTWSISKMQSDTWEERYAIKFCFKLGKNATQKRMECFRLLLEHLAWIEHQFLSGIRDSRKTGSLWRMMRGVGGVKKSEHHSWLGKGYGYYVKVLREFRKRFIRRGQHSSNRVSGISTWTMHQSTTPSLSQTIWPRWASRQFLSLSIVQTLLPVTFGYSLGSEAVVMRQLRERGCDEGYWHGHTRGLLWGLAEVFGTVQVHCCHWRLLRRWLEFHMCTINKSAHTKSLETYCMHLVYINIYIYTDIYICIHTHTHTHTHIYITCGEVNVLVGLGTHVI